MPSQSLTYLDPPRGRAPVRVLRRRAAFGLDRPQRFDKEAARRSLSDWLACALPDACVLHAITDEGTIRMADVTVLLANGRCVFFDITATPGKTRRGTSAFEDFCTAARIPYARVRHVNDARAALVRFAIPTREAA
ncbi:hypothetical protein [Methylovirgula sp. 4M-Z18]|uniref:hypothetical protein n=1 Tax=Methylovirgula sp. 4M-Z18 TaxID=2293567 RepID=UPI000E2FCD04|nr:hypothetical protein [Methylovirgula sp. 4M-Z18]